MSPVLIFFLLQVKFLQKSLANKWRRSCAHHLLQRNINGGLQENASLPPVIYFSYQTTHIYIYTIAIKIVQTTTFFSANGHKLHFFLSQFNLQ